MRAVLRAVGLLVLAGVVLAAASWAAGAALLAIAAAR